MPSYTPVYSPGDAMSATASAAVTGGQLVEITGSGTVGPAGANSTKVIGIAAHDAAINARVTVHVGKHVHEATASGAIAAGDILVSAAAGQVSTLAAVTTPTAADVTNTRAIVGVALTTAATGAKVQYVTR